MNYTTATELALAIAIGLIIGLERGWHSRQEPEGKQNAGIRSFALVGLLGGISGLCGELLGVLFAATVLLVIGILIAVAYWRQTLNDDDVGITTELALFVTFGLGVFSVLGFHIEAVATAALVALLLQIKPVIHKSLQKLKGKEVSATLQLLVLFAVVLPLLPDENLGPWGGVNPRVVGLLVLLIAAISYVGYFAIRMLGPRAGILTTALLGGLTSSTAVTIAFAQIARRNKAHYALLAAGIALASATMIPRLLLIIAAVNRDMVAPLIWPLLILGFVPLLVITPIWWLVDRSTKSDGEGAAGLTLKNPLELKAALIFGVVLTALIFLVRVAKEYLGEAGVYTIAALSGLADVDAVSISLADAAKQNLPLASAALGVMVAAVVNTLTKAGIAMAIGGWKLGRWVFFIFILASIAAVLAVAMA